MLFFNISSFSAVIPYIFPFTFLSAFCAFYLDLIWVACLGKMESEARRSCTQHSCAATWSHGVLLPIHLQRGSQSTDLCVLAAATTTTTSTSSTTTTATTSATTASEAASVVQSHSAERLGVQLALFVAGHASFVAFKTIQRIARDRVKERRFLIMRLSNKSGFNI